MELDDVLSGSQAWWPLLGMLLYAVPLGLLRVACPGPAPPHVRAVDGLSMLALGWALPWACQHLTVGQAAAGVGTVVPVLLACRHHLTRAAARRSPPCTSPRLLLFRGRFLPGALQAARLSEIAVRRQLARQGIRRVRSLFVLIQEADGTLIWSRLPAAPAVFTQLPDTGRLNPN